MQITPRSENHGNTVRLAGASQLSGLRVSHTARPSHGGDDAMSDEDEDFQALMNSDKSKRSAAFEGGVSGAGPPPSPSRYEPPGGSTPAPEARYDRPSTPTFMADPPPPSGGYGGGGGSASHGDPSFRSIDEEKQHYVYRIQRMQSRIPGRRVGMETPLDELKYEHDRLKRQQELNSSVKFQRRTLMAAVTGVEFLNKQFNPLGLHLDGWSETVMDSLEDYDPTFEQLHERYTGTAEVSPEWNLMIMLLGSGFMYHLSNTLFRSVLPNVNDIARQNPDLMQNIANAMSGAMGQPAAATAGQTPTQMGANLAMQAMKSRAGAASSDAASSSALVEEDEDEDEDDDGGRDGGGFSPLEPSTRRVAPPPPRTAPRAAKVDDAMRRSASMVLPPNPTALQRPMASVMEDEEASDMSSELSGMSEELRDVGKGRKQRKKNDSRKAIDLTF